MKKLDYTINANTSELSIPVIDTVLLCKREGIGLKKVEQATATVNHSVNSFQYRAANTMLPIPSGAGFTKNATQQLTLTTWRQTFRVLNIVLEGSIYNFTLNGITVSYEAMLGDGSIGVVNALKTLIDATSFGVGVVCTVSDIMFMGEPYRLLLIDTTGLPATTSNYYPPGYFIAKSGLYVTIDGGKYILEETEQEGYELPAVPLIDLSYNFNTLIFAQYGIEFYLYEASYPTEVFFLETLALGTTDINNIPTGIVSLSPEEFTHDQNNNKLLFGNPFVSGSPENVKILYK